ncbi:MAG TPA: SAM-dependent methyltransferase [Mycobacteriales bacterium]|nr:SAM-dependent methyltransferase [Mycobacteriales bacterium]
MAVGRDWLAWHESYDDETSPLARRLRFIQQAIGRWLDERPDARLTALSVCAGQGHDVLGVLAERPDGSRVRATLLESDPRNVAAARAAVERAALANVAIVDADAGDLAAYVGLVPADLILMAGVFGNISDDDVHRTIEALPMLCAPDATVIWTRSRRAPDLTPAVRRWLGESGLLEQVFHAPDGVLFSVGVHQFAGVPHALRPQARLFRFIR